MNHKDIGKKLKLFFFDDISPGSCFFLPHGAKLYIKLVSYLRSKYKELGYKEVITPNIYNKKLWEISGHWGKYKENMFILNKNKDENDEFSLKPMNCPGHCMMFKNLSFSYKDLPIRWADFGVLHRNELTGALRGLTRVRRFQQDDAHIFCTLEQVGDEIDSFLKFLKDTYTMFGFKFKVELSTRPKDYIGNIDVWNNAEEILKNKIKSFPKWEINEGDGAFYGPKIDVMIKDNMKRFHQCGTVQLDFNLPERFDLTYKTTDGKRKRPVLIHRAILGSIERFIAILLEHTSGRLPFNFSPRQIMIVPVSNKYIEYGKSIMNKLNNYDIEIDDSTNTLNKKIRNAEKLKFNYIFVIGEKEKESNMINVRINKKTLGLMNIKGFIELINKN